MKQLIVLLFLILMIENLYSQNLFPEKFDECEIKTFRLESKITSARISNEDLLVSLLKGKSLTQIEGVLLMQIYVDKNGNACLVSVDNKTNTPSSEFNLSKAINKTKWTNNTDPVCAIVHITFKNGTAKVRRLGSDANLGVHEITDTHNPLYDLPKDTRNKNTTNNPSVLKDEKTNSVWKLYTFENSKLPYDLCRSAEVDSKGDVWIATDEGIVKISGKEWTVLDANNSGLESNKMGNTVTSYLAVDSRDNVWTETMSKIKIFDGDSWKTIDKSNSPITKSGEIISQDSTIWIIGFDGFYEYTNEKWSEYNIHNSGLASNTIRGVYRDKANNLWVGTDEGLSFYDGEKWNTYNSENSIMPANAVRVVRGDKQGNVWIGVSTNKGDNIGGIVMITPENKWTVYTMKNSKLPSSTVSDIKFEGKNHEIVWICTGNFLVRKEGDNWEIYDNTNSFIPKNYVSALAIDKNGNKWIATYGGLIFTTR